MQIPTNGIDLSNAEWKQQGLLVYPRNAVLTKSAAYLQIVAGLSKNKIAYVWESIDFYSGTTDVLKPDDRLQSVGCLTLDLPLSDCNLSTGIGIEWDDEDDEVRLADFPLASGVFRLTKQPKSFDTLPKGKSSQRDFGYGPSKVVCRHQVSRHGSNQPQIR